MPLPSVYKSPVNARGAKTATAADCIASTPQWYTYTPELGHVA